MSQTHDNAMKSREHLRQAIARYWDKDIDVVRGPLTVAEVENELVAHGWASPAQLPEWNRFKAKLKGGDEFYFFRSDERSWRELLGVEGYVAVRAGKVTAGMFVSLN